MHTVHLVQSTRLETVGHQENVRTTLNQMSQLFVKDVRKLEKEFETVKDTLIDEIIEEVIEEISKEQGSKEQESKGDIS